MYTINTRQICLLPYFFFLSIFNHQLGIMYTSVIKKKKPENKSLFFQLKVLYNVCITSVIISRVQRQKKKIYITLYIKKKKSVYARQVYVDDCRERYLQNNIITKGKTFLSKGKRTRHCIGMVPIPQVPSPYVRVRCLRVRLSVHIYIYMYINICEFVSECVSLSLFSLLSLMNTRHNNRVSSTR